MRNGSRPSTKLRIEDSDFDGVLDDDLEKFYEKNYSSVIGKLFNYDKSKYLLILYLFLLLDFAMKMRTIFRIWKLDLLESEGRKTEGKHCDDPRPSAKIAMFEDRKEALLLKKIHSKNKH